MELGVDYPGTGTRWGQQSDNGGTLPIHAPGAKEEERGNMAIGKDVSKTSLREIIDYRIFWGGGSGGENRNVKGPAKVNGNSNY